MQESIDDRVLRRFWAKVDKSDSCWLWIAAKISSGYGHFHYAGRRVRAHRFAWELLRGPIPEDLQLDHLCRNRACVNPDHLEPVDARTNLLRGDTYAARNSRKTHCPRGHALEGENIYWYHGRSGWTRTCLICKKESLKRWTARSRKRSTDELHSVGGLGP